VSTLLSIKTGRCPEDCKYCPQSSRYNTEIENEALLELRQVINRATKAKESGATRFCMGAAWRKPNSRDFPKVLAMVTAVKEMGLETCVTLGTLDFDQATALKEAGLDYYNHNIDSSPEFYKTIITTRPFEERLSTLKHVQTAGMKTCSGGIVGMGETVRDRAEMLRVLTALDTPPESVPINMLIAVPGTPLENAKPIHPLDFVRTIAVARIVLPTSTVRLSAGREKMSDEVQALCFTAGANSVFYGERLLTCRNPVPEKDLALFEKLGLKPAPAHTKAAQA
jgi:biotin synthase